MYLYVCFSNLRTEKKTVYVLCFFFLNCVVFMAENTFSVKCSFLSKQVLLCYMPGTCKSRVLAAPKTSLLFKFKLCSQPHWALFIYNCLETKSKVALYVQ